MSVHRNVESVGPTNDSPVEVVATLATSAIADETISRNKGAELQGGDGTGSVLCQSRAY